MMFRCGLCGELSAPVVWQGPDTPRPFRLCRAGDMYWDECPYPSVYDEVLPVEGEG